MSDFGTMQDRIADELARTDLTTQIQKSIQSAIDHYERQGFYINESTFTFSTVQDQEYYGSADSATIPLLADILTVRLTVNSNTYTLIERDFQYLESVQSNGNYTGDPTEFAYFNKQIRLYPVPYTARTVQVAGTTRPDALSATSDTNVWMTDAEELIRCRAKYDLFVHVIRNPEEAMGMRSAEMDALAALRGETDQRVSSGHLRPTAF